MSASKLYEQMKDDDELDYDEISEELSKNGLDILMSAYVNKQDKLSWTFQGVKLTWKLCDMQ